MMKGEQHTMAEWKQMIAEERAKDKAAKGKKADETAACRSESKG